MDLDKIFLKDACPTSVGGQAVMEGIMMRGVERSAIAVRVPDGRIHMKTYPNKKLGKWAKVPLIRGVVSFVSSLVQGTSTLMYSADVLEEYWTDEEAYEPDKMEEWLNKKFGEKGTWNIMMYISVIIAIAFSVGIFILLPTVVVNWADGFIKSPVLLNLLEGIVRLLLFGIYVVLISKMEDIKRVFQYHGAEHKTIHCFEKNLELTPENAQQFYTLHPRCGTSSWYSSWSSV